jgi:hypothetical protein
MGPFLRLKATQHAPKDTCATPGAKEDKLGKNNEA